MTQKILKDHYFMLRQTCPDLKQIGYLFEAMPWRWDGKMLKRQNAKHELRVYRIDGDVECCVVYPNGTSKTFATPLEK